MASGTPAAGDDTAAILIVDDHDENLLALEAILTKPGIEILTARSGNEALRLILEHDFAVILLDVLMPTMDGFETARLIRTREASRHTPIVFLTAAGSDVDMVYRGYAVGAVDYLIKPLNPDIVKAKVAVFVDLFRKTRQIHRQEKALRAVERERNQAALRESEALYEASFNAAAVGIAHTSADGRWLRVNPRFCQIIGYSREETLRLRFHDVTHPEDLPEEVLGFRQLITGEIGAYHREKRYLHKTGQQVWVDMTVSLVYDGRGKPKHFIAVVEDITERKRTEDRQRLLAGASQIMLGSLDPSTTIEDVAHLATTSLCEWCIVATTNHSDEPACYVAVAHRDPALGVLASEVQQTLLADQSFHQVLGLGQAELVADLSRVATDEWKLPRAIADMFCRLGSGSAIIVPLEVRDQILGQLVLVSAQGEKPFSAGDLATAQDLAQRIALGAENARLYHDAQLAIRARDEFLSIASHELRTPLTPLQIHFQRLLRQPGDQLLAAPDRLQNTLERCERQVRRLEALIDNLLDVSRISSGGLRLQQETVDLADVVRDVSGRFTEELAAAGCELLLDTDEPVVGQWDRLRLEQIVNNVLGNAIKYGGGKPIAIRVEGTADRARLQIRDQGIGIDGQDLSRIFHRFQRAVSSRSYGGLGLGLYITRQIVDAHFGSIKVESQPGAGSVFIVELPKVLPESAALDQSPIEGTNVTYGRRAHASS